MKDNVMDPIFFAFLDLELQVMLNPEKIISDPKHCTVVLKITLNMMCYKLQANYIFYIIYTCKTSTVCIVYEYISGNVKISVY